jgi:hypothetical protein
MPDRPFQFPFFACIYIGWVYSFTHVFIVLFRLFRLRKLFKLTTTTLFTKAMHGCVHKGVTCHMQTLNAEGVGWFVEQGAYHTFSMDLLGLELIVLTH